MTVNYYNWIDELIAVFDKNHADFSGNLKSEAKYAIVNEGKAEELTVNNPDFVAGNILDDLKNDVKSKIDQMTEQIFSQGFVDSGETFSMDVESRNEYFSIQSMLNRGGAPFSFPILITLKDKTLPRFSFTNVALWNAFLDNFTTYYMNKKGEGADLKDQVDLAVDEDGLKAIITLNNNRIIL